MTDEQLRQFIERWEEEREEVIGDLQTTQDVYFMGLSEGQIEILIERLRALLERIELV